MVAGYVLGLAAVLGLWFRWLEPWYEPTPLPSWSPSLQTLRWSWASGLLSTGGAFWLINADRGRLTGLAFGLLWAQLTLAAAWSLVFFRRRRARTGFTVICLVWTAAALAASALSALQPAAGLLILPWLGLVAYVGAFNFFVWQLENTT